MKQTLALLVLTTAALAMLLAAAPSKPAKPPAKTPGIQAEKPPQSELKAATASSTGYWDIQNWPQLFPLGYHTVCTMPQYTVYNVKDYGAKGDGTTDDTPAIRAALAAATANGSGIIYLPNGKFAVCPQPGDKPQWGPIFSITSKNIIFCGAGQRDSGDGWGTTLIGFCAGLKDPKTTWATTGDAYSKIGRFSMFSLVTAKTPITGFQVRSMTVNGQAGYTGNATVGGIVATGDGWDLTHKAFLLNGASTVDKILLFNLDICNWRGEEVYAGGGNIKKVRLVSSKIRGTNSSAVSCSADLEVLGCTIGGTNPADDAYNGLENYAVSPPQKTLLKDTTVQTSSSKGTPGGNPGGNGVVLIGAPGTSTLIDNCKILNNHQAILLSEACTNLTVLNTQFSGNANGCITSVLGLYKGLKVGFGNFKFQNCTFSDDGSTFVAQTGRVPNFVMRRCTVTKGFLLDGTWTNQAGTPSRFLIDACTLAAGTRFETGAYSGDIPLCTNMQLQPDGSYAPPEDAIDVPDSAGVR